MERGNVKVRLNSRVKQITTVDGHVSGVKLEDGSELTAESIILATGGLSASGTGSTGDGYRIAEETGHALVPRSAVLVGINTIETWPMELQGLSLRNVTLTLRKGKKKLYSELGEMLFTHYGISGPLVLEASCHLPEAISEAEINIDLKPGLTPEQLDQRLVREMTQNSRKQLRSIMPSLLPGKMAEVFPVLAGINDTITCDQATREMREALCNKMKNLSLHIRCLRPIEEAIVTRGGISVKQVNPSTMESKIVDGLFFAG